MLKLLFIFNLGMARFTQQSNGTIISSFKYNYLQGDYMLIELLRKRRSIRQFDNRPVEQEKIEQLVEAVLRSPSSRGLNPWEFIIVTDRDKITALAEAKPHGSTFLKQAPLAIVVCADPEKSDVWVEDCSIAALLAHLAAADLDLGSCWIQIRKRDHSDGVSSEHYVKQCLHIPEKMAVEAIVAIGYGKDEKTGHERSSLLDEKVHFNTMSS
jgi:nitroreductase